MADIIDDLQRVVDDPENSLEEALQQELDEMQLMQELEAEAQSLSQQQPITPPPEQTVATVGEEKETTTEIPEQAGETVQEEDPNYGILKHIAETPEGVIFGASKALGQTNKLVNNLSGGLYYAADDLFQKYVHNSGYLHFTDSTMYWTKNKSPYDAEGNVIASELPDDAVQVFNLETATANIVGGLSQFASGLLMTRGAGKAAGVKNLNSGTSLAAQGIIGEQIAFDPYEARLSDLVQDFPSLQNPITEYLQSDPEDTEAEARFKMAIEALGMEGAGMGLFATVKVVNAYRKGLKADPTDIEALEKFIEEAGAKVGVSLDELEAKMLKASRAQTKLQQTYKRIDANKAVLSPATIAAAKQSARVEAEAGTKKAVGDTEFDQIGQETGYGVHKTNKQLIRQADDVIAEHFDDVASVKENLQALDLAYPNAHEKDIVYTAMGRVLQMTSKNFAVASQNWRIIRAENEAKIRKIAERQDLTEADKVTLLKELQIQFEKDQKIYHDVQLDYLSSVYAFRGAGKSLGRAVQVSKLFQNFNVPEYAVQRHFDELLDNLPSDKARNSFVNRSAAYMLRVGSKSLKALDEIFITSILSGFKTHVINPTSNAAKAIAVPTERLAAAGLRLSVGDTQGAKETWQAGVDQFIGMRYALSSSWNYAGKAYKIGQAQLDNHHTYEDQGKAVIGKDLAFDKNTLENLGTWMKENPTGTMVDLFGTTIRAVSTRALTMEDEFFKQLNFQGQVYSLARRDLRKSAKEKGLKGEELESFLHTEAEKAVDFAVKEQFRVANGTLSKNARKSPYGEDALQYAQEGTFTQQLGTGSQSFQNMVEKVPLMRQIFPFVRTPLNLHSDLIQRSPLAFASGRWREDMAAGGERSALAMVRYAYGTAIMASWLTQSTESGWEFDDGSEYGEYQMRGAGPTNVGERQNMQEVGGIIYGSILTPDGQQYQISRADPFSSQLEMVGLIQEFTRAGKFEEAEEVYVAAALGLANMMANETYGTSVRQLMYSMQSEAGFEKFLKGRTGQIVPMSGMLGTISAYNDPYQRESRTYLDAIKSKIPGIRQDVPPRYNILGEPIPKTNYATAGVFPEFIEDMASPIMTGKVKTDPVSVAFQNQGITVTKQSPKIAGGLVDMHSPEFRTSPTGKPLYPDNRSAYDQFNFILGNTGLEKFGGKTLREALHEAVTTRRYEYAGATPNIKIRLSTGDRKFVEFKGKKDAILRAIIQEAKDEALQRVIADNPKLALAVQHVEAAGDMAMSPEGQKLIEVYNELNAPLTGN